MQFRFKGGPVFDEFISTLEKAADQVKDPRQIREIKRQMTTHEDYDRLDAAKESLTQILA